MIMQQSLWAIARSPLIYGGRVKDITTANPHIAILTNPRVLAVSDTSSRNRQVRRSNSSAVWVAETATSGSVYVGLFSLAGSGGGGGGVAAAVPVSATFAELGLPAGVTSANVTDLWSGDTLAQAQGGVSAALSPCSSKSAGPCAALLRLSWSGE
jgi:hypothetical protein